VIIRLKYVHAFRDRAGRMRYYFRRHGKRTPLPGLPGCSEFMDAYATLLSDQPQPAEQRRAAAPKTFAALAIRYYGSPQYQSLSASSRTNYRRVIDGFLEEQGHRRVDQMTREHLDIVIGKVANKPGAGIILLKPTHKLSHVRPTKFTNIATHAVDAFTHELGRTRADADSQKIPKNGYFSRSAATMANKREHRVWRRECQSIPLER
jgi:hypothetical protein